MAFWRQHLNLSLSVIILIILILLTFFMGFKIGKELYQISSPDISYSESQ